MDSKKIVFHETAVVTVGQVICVAVMFGIYALLNLFDNTVLLGGIVGGLLAILNFLFMAIGVSLAADKAQAQDVKGGKGLVRMSMMLRYVVLLVVLFACAKSDLFDVFSLVIPLVFVRPTLTIAEFFRRKTGEENK